MIKTERPTIQVSVWAAGLYAILAGITTLVAGSAALEGQAFTAAVNLARSVHVEPATLWGVSAILVGALTLVPRRKVSQWGLFGAAAWSAFWALSLAASSPPSGYRGVVAYLYIAVMISMLIVFRRVYSRIE